MFSSVLAVTGEKGMRVLTRSIAESMSTSSVETKIIQNVTPRSRPAACGSSTSEAETSAGTKTEDTSTSLFVSDMEGAGAGAGATSLSAGASSAIRVTGGSSGHKMNDEIERRAGRDARGG